MPNIWKIILTLPRFLRMLTKSKSMARKIKRDPNIVSEEYRYHWLQKRTKYMLWIFDIKLIVHNEENWIDKGCLMVANHQSNIDPAIIFRLNDFNKTAPCAFIAKKELATDKRFKNFVALIDVLFLDRKNPRQAIEVINEANELIRVPRTMVVFPEGTRSHQQEMGEFQAGSFKIAQKAHAPIIPVSLVNSYQVLNKKVKQKGKKYIHVVFHKPIKPDTFMTKPTDLISNNVKQIIQKGIDQYKDVDHKKAYEKYRAELKQKAKNA
ncbi:lysophospholipid acyltransferase family protein [Spiroplasma eriocheiris]|uniref:1-acyl-sn-glycerol-3-phosphate acyltransferase n=1 Tax=Spiroplasma eriocheiris TaxID=315358 RepID=A0A0H3XKR5_9MOLU|nr:lysophospholipid acyltransferase family protein [Spiroplasma eriocheiris]AHF57582.1 putative 1-acyl-sn-glycerol-3-phosphate acyltransferase [Spiroplasma eriocheiris CCTCC M 207170]AKM54039.1 1-acyl-sn-glycerol-3-phosphate acyltransferase [Spiroplasma eriocheiris]